MDAAGNLYGTTSFGGNTGCPNSDGCGVVFKLTADGTYTVLYSFCPQSGCADGKYPHAGLIMDAAGNLYGTTAGGDVVSPTFPYGDGVVFKLAPDGTYTVLYTFCSQGPPCADGSQPAAGLIIDAAGNLYGTTAYGGIVNPNDPLDSGSGVVFKLTP